MAWTAEDCALLLQQMAGFDPSDRASANVPDFTAGIGKGLRGLRVGVVRRFHETDYPVSPATASAIASSIGILRDAGADISKIELSSLSEYSAANHIIMNAEVAAYHEQMLKERFLEFGERLRHRLLVASFLTSNDYIQAQRRRHELCAEFALAMRNVDVLITAASAAEAPLMNEVPF